jgi:hypothetical protein
MRRAAILLGVPVALAALVAWPLAEAHGPLHWLCAGVAVALVVPPGLVTLVLSERLARSRAFGPMGSFVALAVGTAVRLFVGFGGAVAVFFLARPVFHEKPLAYLGWLLGVYLTTLVTETVLLARPAKGPAAGAPTRIASGEVR